MQRVELGNHLGIETAAELKTLLQAHLDHKDPVALDASQVQRVHTASIQLLCAFVRDRRKAGKATTIEPCADSLRDAASVLGVSTDLGLAQ